MIQKTILISGSAAVGKTAILQFLIPYLRQAGARPCVCKIDCLHTQDDQIYRRLEVPYVVGLSGDICPDHYLVSNLTELIAWGGQQRCDLLLIETAGLCHRCCPATEKTISVCAVDCTASCKAPEKLGPMLTKADLIALTKIDMVSQAEREIIQYQIQSLNPDAAIFPVDGISGYGVELLGRHICALPTTDTFEGDYLRHTMPSGVCSYCIGEQRIGSQFQQGVVGKIDFGGI